MGKRRPVGPAAPFPTPLGLDGQGCQIIFGHNAEVRRVMMQFGVAVTALTFTPEEADDVAMRLAHYAKAARGEAVA